MNHQIDSLLRIITSGSSASRPLENRVSLLRDFETACRSVAYSPKRLDTVCGRLSEMISEWTGIEGLTVLVTPGTHELNGSEVISKYSPVVLPCGGKLYDCYTQVLCHQNKDVGAFQILDTTDWVFSPRIRDLLAACMLLLARYIDCHREFDKFLTDRKLEY